MLVDHEFVPVMQTEYVKELLNLESGKIREKKERERREKAEAENTVEVEKDGKHDLENGDGVEARVLKKIKIEI